MLAKLQKQIVYHLRYYTYMWHPASILLGNIDKRSWPSDRKLSPFFIGTGQKWRALHLSYSHLVNKGGLCSKACTGGSGDDSCFYIRSRCSHWCGFAVWLHEHLVHQYLLHSQSQCPRKMELRKTTTLYQIGTLISLDWKQIAQGACLVPPSRRMFRMKQGI